MAAFLVAATKLGTGSTKISHEDDMAAEIDHAKEMKAHEGTYGFFIGMLKWGTILAAIAVLLVVLLIT